MRRAVAALVLVALAGCGDGDDEAAAPAPPETAPSVATVPTQSAPGAEPEPTATTPAEPATVRLLAPSDGDQYLEGSTDSRAEFKCRNASSCEATVQRLDGGAAKPIENGGRLPTDPGRYRFRVVAGGPGGDADAEAVYEVPDLPGDGGSAQDTKPPPNLPEAGP